MATFQAGEYLIGELLRDPAKFNEDGRAYELLQSYLNSFPVRTLAPLLESDDEFVRRAAVWIASELGQDASELIPHVIPLDDDDDRFIAYHAMEVLMVCSVGRNVDAFVHVARALESDDEVIRQHGMRLLSKALPEQIDAALRCSDTLGASHKTHRNGLAQLREYAAASAGEVLGMLSSDLPLMRKYGAIVAKKLMGRQPGIIETAAKSSDDDVRTYAREDPVESKN